MSEDVAVTASSLLNSQHFRDFKSDWRLNGTPSVATTTSTTTATPVVPQPNAGGQMMTMSPPAGDGAGTAGSTAPEETSASDISGDAESVWSVDIDQAFQEALAIYPPCGRRKIIISDEGKMYGRNELIARYIKLRCGKTRTRKQVSSHIQVLARKKLRDEQAKKKQEAVSLNMPQVSGVNSLNSSMNSNTLDTSAISQQPPSAQPLPQTQARVAASTTSPIAVTSTAPQIAQSLPNFPCVFPKVDPSTNSSDQLSQQFLLSSLWSLPQAVTGLPAQLPFGMDLSQLVLPKIETVEQVQRPIASSSLSLLAFSAFAQSNQTSQRTELVKIDNSLEEEGIEISLFYEKYPEILRDLFEKSPKKDMFFLAKCWANINVSNDVINTQYAVDSLYTSREKFQLKVSTMACSFGKQAVEKIEFYPPTECNGLYTFSLKNSPMCDYMVKFISELKKLENIEYMNSVLENFTVLQIVSNTETNETLMVICFVFEVSKEPEPSCAVYRLISHSPPPTIHNQTF